MLCPSESKTCQTGYTLMRIHPILFMRSRPLMTSSALIYSTTNLWDSTAKRGLKHPYYTTNKDSSKKTSSEKSSFKDCSKMKTVVQRSSVLTPSLPHTCQDKCQRWHLRMVKENGVLPEGEEQWSRRKDKVKSLTLSDVKVPISSGEDKQAFVTFFWIHKIDGSILFNICGSTK